MTTKQERAVIRQIADIGKTLGLDGWVFTLSATPAPEGAAAQVETPYGHRTATIFLASDWLCMSPAERHVTLIHELIHVVFSPLRTYLRETLPDLVGQPAFQSIENARRLLDETAVEQLAQGIAPLLPVAPDA